MSSKTSNAQKSTGEPSDDRNPAINVAEIEATLSELESQIDAARDRLATLDHAGPNGKLRQIRRKTEGNAVSINSIGSDVQSLQVEIDELQGAVRRLQGLQAQVIRLEGRVERVEGELDVA